MAEENNDNISEENLKSQVDLANELNNVLSQVSSKMERINNIVSNQSSIINSMTESFKQMSSSADNMASSIKSMSESISDAAEKFHENFNKKKFDEMNEGLEEVSKTAQNAITTQRESLKEMGDNVKKAGSTTEEVNKSYAKSSASLTKGVKANAKSFASLYDSGSKARKELASFTEELKETSEKLEDVSSGYLGAIKKYIGMIIEGGRNLISFVGSMVGNMISFAKHAVTLPFTVAKAAASIGYKLREQVAQIKEAGEDLKNTFDFQSSVGQGIQSLVSRGTGMLKSFQSPSNELVKIFGLGVGGITNMIKFLGENIGAMEQFSEIFGESILKNDKKMKNFIRLVKGLGFSAEDIKYISLDASNNIKDVNVRMAEITVTLSNTATEFGVDRKRLSKNFMILRKDITQFGHLSDEEIARTTARLTQMRVKLEDAVAVFKKFSTFEDAANSVAMLSQTFGMNLDAMDIIKAKNPEDIIEMFRNSMLETGRSYQDLNRFEKDLMAQHTGISEQSLSALMHFRDIGLTYEQAKKRMESQTPEAKQMKAIKKLNSAIKELQKVLKFDSPFQAFFRGITNNLNLTGDLKNTMMSLSSGYEGIYKFALNLKPDVWMGLVKPIKIIIDIMRNILQSEGFRKGLVGTLKAVSGFVADMFGASSGDTVLSKIENNVRVALGKGGFLYENDTEKKRFNNIILAAVNKNKKNLGMLIDEKDYKGLQKITDPLELIRRLKEFKSSLKKNDPAYKKFDSMLEDAASGIVSTYDPKKINMPGKASEKLSKKVSPEKLFANSMKDVVEQNADNSSNLFKLSMNVAGAILKGAITGGTAILMVINDQIRKFKTKTPGAGESTNMIERMLGFKPGEFNQLGKAISSAFVEFISSLDKNSGIFGWIAKGIYDVFSIIAEVFVGTLKGALFEIMGIENKQTTSQLKKSRSSKLARPNVSKTLSSIEESKVLDDQSYFGVDQKRTDAVDIFYAMEDFSKKYKGNNNAQLQSAVSAIGSRLDNNSLTNQELSSLTERFADIQKEIVENNNVVNQQIETKLQKLTNILTTFEANKIQKEGGIGYKFRQSQSQDFEEKSGLRALQGGVAVGLAGKTANKIMKSKSMLASGVKKAGGSVVNALKSQYAKRSIGKKLGKFALGRGLKFLGKGILGAAAAAVGSPVLAGLAAASTIYGIYEAASWLLSSNTNVEKLNSGRVQGNNVQVDSALKDNILYKTADTSEINVLFNKQNEQVIAQHSALNQFKEQLKIQKPKVNKITREEYQSFVDAIQNIQKESENPLNISANCIVTPEVRQEISKQNVRDGHWSLNTRPDLNQGRYSPSEAGGFVNSSGADGAANTSAKPFYGNQSFNRN